MTGCRPRTERERGHEREGGQACFDPFPASQDGSCASKASHFSRPRRIPLREDWRVELDLSASFLRPTLIGHLFLHRHQLDEQEAKMIGQLRTRTSCFGRYELSKHSQWR